VTLRLTVQRDAWSAAVRSTASSLGDMIPVIKGNGYGFGAHVLMSHAILFADTIAVGTIYESRTVPSSHAPMVLTPVGNDVGSLTVHPRAILTVGSPDHLTTLQRLGYNGRIVIKLRSSMNRYGIDPDECNAIRGTAETSGIEIAGWSLHPPLAENGRDHASEVSTWLSRLDATLPLYVSHVGAASLTALRSQHPQHRIVVRSGTKLWLGDKAHMRLSTEVVDVRRGVTGTAGYRPNAVPSGATIVMVGAGSSHGIGALTDGASPFHFGKQRMPLLEAPHMHTSMLIVNAESPCPQYGDSIDVQQPMTRVFPDVIDWV
jgi:alanine racemase